MRRFKIFFFILFFISLILVAGILYLNIIFLPFQAKDFATKKAQDFFKSEVSIKKITFSLLKGFVIKDVLVSEKDNKNLPLIEIEEIRFSVPLPDIFRKEQVFIPSITLVKPKFFLNYRGNNQWNISHLLSGKEKAKTLPSFDFYTKAKEVSLNDIRIEQGQIIITNQTLTQAISNFNASAQFALPDKIIFNADMIVMDNSAKIKIKGQYLLSSQELLATLNTANFNPLNFINLLNIPLYVDLNECLVNSASVDIKFKDSTLTAEGSLSGPINIQTNTGRKAKLVGEVSSDTFFFRKKGSDFNLHGVFLANKTTLTVDENKTFVGRFTGENMHFQRTAGQLTMTGNIFGRNVKMNFANQELNGDAQIERFVFKKDGSDLSIAGHAKISRANYTGPSWEIASDTAILEFLLNQDKFGIGVVVPTLSTENLYGQILGKKISAHAKGQEFYLTILGNIIQVQGQLKTKNLKFSISDTETFSGSPDLKFALTRNPAINDLPITYRGTAIFNDDALLGNAQLGNIQNLKGLLTFNTNEAKSENLSCTLGPLALTVSGSVNNFRAPELDITIQTDKAEIKEIKKYFTSQLTKLDTDISGSLQKTTFTYQGPLSSSQSAKITVDTLIKDGELSSKAIPDKVSSINGHLRYSPNSLNWDNLKFSYQNKDYAVDGFAKDFATPYIKTILSGKNFKVSLAGIKNKENISLSILQGQYFNTSFDLKGNVVLHEGPADIDLTGSIALDLAELSSLPQIKDKLTQAAPQGIVNLDGQYSLPALSWEKMTLNAKARAKEISLHGFLYKDFVAEIKPLAKNQHHLTINSLVYEGKLSVDVKLNFSEVNVPAEVVFQLDELNITKIKETLSDLKDKELAGFLDLTTKFNGPLLKAKEIAGSGTIAVKDGKLLELEMFKGMWKVLFSGLLVEEYKKIAFTEGKANFKIAAGQILTDDCILKSVPADISARGWVDFDHNINFDVIADVHEAPMVTAQTAKAVPTTIISQVAQNFVGIKLTGSLSDPKIKYKILPLKFLQKTSTSIFHGIQGMFEDLM